MNTISSNCTNVVKQFEGCVLHAYQDPKGIWTIGWGRTAGVHAGQVITQAQADAWLVEDLNRFAQIVASLVKVPINQNQFDALTSFEYNTGALGSSDLLKYVNAKNFAAASNEFPKWCHATIRGVKEVLPGLVKRRAAEQALFNKPVPSAAKAYFHKVVAGDTLSEIASEYHTTVAALVKLNKLPDPNKIRVGQMIRVK